MTDLAKFIFALIFVAIVLGAGLAVLSEVREATKGKFSVSDESLAILDAVPKVVQTDHYPVVEYSESLYLYNTTAEAKVADLVRDENYTVIDYDTGQFNITNASPTGSDIEVRASYQYVGDTDASSAIANLTSKIGNVSVWIGILIIVTLAGIIMRALKF